MNLKTKGVILQNSPISVLKRFTLIDGTAPTVEQIASVVVTECTGLRV